MVGMKWPAGPELLCGLTESRMRSSGLETGESVQPKDLVSWSLRRARTKITYNSSV